MRYLLSALLVLTTGTGAIAGPDDEQDRPPFQAPRSSPDFLFGRPNGSIGVRGSWIFLRASSDWYDFVGDQLTIGDGAFNAPGIGADVAFSLTPRLDAVFSVDYSSRKEFSEYRDFVDNNRLPINQTTELRGVNLGGGIKFSLTPRGDEVGRLAWVPRGVVPYVGAGGGFYWYEVLQYGDFIDYVDYSVFTDAFEASGWTPSATVFGGADVKLHRRVFLNFEARYLWAAGNLGPQWIDFEPIDLAGLRVATGINFVF
jgi:hypothetical protein